jgi:hypothetical protein
VTSVDRVWQSILEVAEVGAEGVTVQEQNVIRVNGSDSLFDPNVKVEQPCVLLVRRFVQRIVTGDPGVVLVVRSEVFPDLDGSVLEVLVYPDWRWMPVSDGNREGPFHLQLTLCLVVTSIGVPVNVLTLDRERDD